MGSPDIKRQCELYIVGKLQAALVDVTVLPFTGGSSTSGATEVEPPFVVITIGPAERTMATEGTWLCPGLAQVITHFAEATSEQQSELSRRVYAALSDSVPTQADATFSFHGIDIQEVTYSDDEDKEFHADIIRFVAGAGG